MPGNFEYQWGQLVARAWDDPAFKSRLLADPSGVLKENGVDAPDGRQFVVVEGDGAAHGDDGLRLVLPARPAAADLSEEELVGAGVGAVHNHGPDAESCFRCGEACHRCSESCHRCSEGCYRCERC